MTYDYTVFDNLEDEFNSRFICLEYSNCMVDSDHWHCLAKIGENCIISPTGKYIKNIELNIL